MSFRTLAITYLLGGLTFLPLVLAAVLATAWYLLPKATHDEESRRDGQVGKSVKDVEEPTNEEQKSRSRQESTSDTGASGTFAVLRKYDFQAAIQALNARQNGNVAGAGQSNDGVAADGGGNGSESVYQSMYRSVFPGNRNTTSNTSILDHEDAQETTTNRRKPSSANVMYIVLRHGHLMLYDSPAQLEVRHVLSLAHHNVSLQSGKDAEDETDDRKIPEADLFIKRTAIVLTPIELPNGAMQSSAREKPAKPIYLFSATSFEKEDFFHALLSSRSQPPTLLPLDPEALIKLQSSLHSSSLTPETRAFNALLGRVFLGIHHTEHLKSFILGKIERKLARIQKPTFISVLQIRSLDLGDAAPAFSNLKLRDLNISGDTTISADMRYNGGLSITLLAVAKLDLGPRFKTRTVDLVLKASMQRVQGTMLLHIKPPPSNRLWYCFENMPELEVRAEPVVSERKITYGFVLRAIEERVRTALGEGLVKPNWDDVPMPLIDTRGSHARGGLWSDEGEDEHPELRPGSARALSDRNEKTMSMPVFAPTVDTGASTGLSSSSEVNIARVRHAATMPVDERQVKRRPVGSSQSAHEPSSPEISQQHNVPPKPLRSPSITLPSPVVAVDGQNVEQVRSDDPSLQHLASQNRLSWRSRGSIPQPPQQKDALDELRDLRARAEQAAAKSSAVGTSDEFDDKNRSVEELTGSRDSDESSLRSQQPSDSNLPATPRSFSVRSTDSERSTAASSSSARGQQTGQRKANLLAAAGAATNVARNWGWNTIQKNRGILPRAGTKHDASPQDTKQPMGRGQPLPPPGQPLPGPNKGIWSGVGNMRRKPVPALPPRRSKTGEVDTNSTPPSSKIPVLARTKSGSSQVAEVGGDDEFGTWQENVVDDDMGLSGGSSESVNAEAGMDHQSNQRHSSASITEDEDLLELSAGGTEPEPETPRSKRPDKDQSKEATPAKQKKIPPPLPARREHLTNKEQASGAADANDGTVNADHEFAKDNEQEKAPETPGLRVPEGTADVIAAENSTVGLEIGAEDDPEHVDESRAVEAEIQPESRGSTATHTESGQLSVGGDSNAVKGSKGRKRANTAERFLRGEDLGEEDFDSEDAIQSDEQQRSHADSAMPSETVESSGEPNQDTREADEVSQRIKAQVGKHKIEPISGAETRNEKANDIDS